MLTPSEIRAAKELAEKATPGEWRKNGRIVFVQRGVIARCPVPQDSGTFECSDNVHFIAASRTLVPALCDTALSAMAERDAAMAALREAHEAVAHARLGLAAQHEHNMVAAGPHNQFVNAWIARIDALLKDKSNG